jgi:hypothetical protein
MPTNLISQLGLTELAGEGDRFDRRATRCL